MSRHHRIDYIEFSVLDMAKAKAFYGSVFGWTFQDYGPEYAGIHGEDREVGGFAVVKEAVAKGGPLVILYSEDLEATLEAVKTAGATITVAPFSFPGGRRFHFEDFSGNVLGVWTQTEHVEETP